MNITQSSLVIIGANTPDRKVFWSGQEVANKVFASVTWTLLVLFAYAMWEYFKKQVKE